jgi:hypothetical protein
VSETNVIHNTPCRRTFECNALTELSVKKRLIGFAWVSAQRKGERRFLGTHLRIARPVHLDRLWPCVGVRTLPIIFDRSLTTPAGGVRAIRWQQFHRATTADRCLARRQEEDTYIIENSNLFVPPCGHVPNTFECCSLNVVVSFTGVRVTSCPNAT